MGSLTRRAALAACGAILARPAIGRPTCGVALVLAIDVSGSVSAESFALQRDATADALRSPAVAHAARDGIAVAVTMWGARQHLALPWQILRGAGDAADAAAALARVGRPGSGGTDVAGALSHAVGLLATVPCEAERRIVDLSGDGRHSGVASEMDVAISLARARGVEVNALPIVTEVEPDVADWYRANVTDPVGGFSISADWQGFARSIRMKLALEVA